MIMALKTTFNRSLPGTHRLITALHRKCFFAWEINVFAFVTDIFVAR